MSHIPGPWNLIEGCEEENWRWTVKAEAEGSEWIIAVLETEAANARLMAIVVAIGFDVFLGE